MNLTNKKKNVCEIEQPPKKKDTSPPDEWFSRTHHTHIVFGTPGEAITSAGFCNAGWVTCGSRKSKLSSPCVASMTSAADQRLTMTTGSLEVFHLCSLSMPPQRNGLTRNCCHLPNPEDQRHQTPRSMWLAQLALPGIREVESSYPDLPISIFIRRRRGSVIKTRGMGITPKPSPHAQYTCSSSLSSLNHTSSTTIHAPTSVPC